MKGIKIYFERYFKLSRYIIMMLVVMGGTTWVLYPISDRLLIFNILWFTGIYFLTDWIFYRKEIKKEVKHGKHK